MLNRHTPENKINTPTPPQSEDLREDRSCFYDVSALLVGFCLAGLLFWVSVETGCLAYILRNLP